MLADWMEIQAFSNTRKIATESDISAISHVDDELDDKNDSIETDAHTEELVNEIFSEFERRERAAGISYPFAINQSGTNLTVNATLTDAHYTYIFCLLVSEYRRRQIIPKRVFEPIAGQIEDLFQICSTVAAAGLLSGCVISFGFPQADGSAFLAALKRAYEDEVGEGQVVLKARPGVSSRTKDGGIDIIAWRHFPRAFRAETRSCAYGDRRRSVRSVFWQGNYGPGKPPAGPGGFRHRHQSGRGMPLQRESKSPGSICHS